MPRDRVVRRSAQWERRPQESPATTGKAISAAAANDHAQPPLHTDFAATITGTQRPAASPCRVADDRGRVRRVDAAGRRRRLPHLAAVVAHRAAAGDRVGMVRLAPARSGARPSDPVACPQCGDRRGADRVRVPVPPFHRTAPRPPPRPVDADRARHRQRVAVLLTGGVGAGRAPDAARAPNRANAGRALDDRRGPQLAHLRRQRAGRSAHGSAAAVDLGAPSRRVWRSWWC